MADDDKLEPSDDPWAALEATNVPDLAGDFSFAFEERSPTDAPAEDADDAVGLPDLFSAGAAAFGAAEEIATEMPAIQGEETSADDPADAPADDAADAGDIDAWLGDPEPAPPLGDLEASSPTLSVFQAEEPESDVTGMTEASFADHDGAADLLAGQSTVEIGTGLSGIPSPSTIGEFGNEFGSFGVATGGSDIGNAEAPVASGADATATDAASDAALEDMFAFAAAEDVPAEDDTAADPFAFAPVGEETGETETGEFDVAVPFAAAAATGAEAATGRPQPAKAPRQPAPRKKKPSMVGQLIGVVLGGAMSFPIVLAILWWGLGKDPLQIAPLVPDSLGFLVPTKFKPGAVGLAASGAGRAPGLDDILGAAGGDAPAPEPTDLADPEPVMEPDEPAVTDVVVDEPAAPVETGPGDDDPLMALLNDEPAPAAVAEPPAPPPIPEPEPLDVAGLERTAAAAAAALQAVVAVGDPADPTFKALAVKWYRTLAAHAEELAMLERVAADTGRPLETLPEAAADVHRGLVAHPELFESLARLTRNWLAYSKRGSDGVVAPATFVSARRVGPYWRSDLQVGDKPLTVLSRSEPAVAPGGTVIVIGLVIDGDTVWASDLQAAEESSPFGL